ncbi:MAG TPA: FtsX-like permease family protein, partial [Gemmataceae bacterium]|nr:FtsX-like permease family protein [Gemmataceae bacterium]
MRFADILGLALSALWQQKARTLLTTLGVIFGSLVLTASLSINSGVQETIERESRRSTQLRRVQVRPGGGGHPSDIADQVEVKGNMSDARRERIRNALVRQKLNFNPGGPRIALTRERLRQLAEIAHVDSVIPSIYLNGFAVFGQRSQRADIMANDPDDDSLPGRIVAGRYFETPHQSAAIVSEFWLYRAGMTDDAAMSAIVGKKIKLEFHVERRLVGVGIFLYKPDGVGTTRDEFSALDKIKKQLPEMLDRFALTGVEKAALKDAFRATPPKAADVFSEEVTVAGVFRMPSDKEQQGRRSSWESMHSDIILPLRMAEDLFFRAPGQGERSLNHATLVVDREENVKEVVKQVREMELDAYAATEWIDRQRLMYLLIFIAMTIVAAVALLVAALGIANTMLMSVLERTREVGIMKAVGAGNGHVQLIFLVEGAIIGLVGGTLGLLLGWAASIPGDRWARDMVQRDMRIELKESLFVFPPWLILA